METVRDAISLLDQLRTFCGDQIDADSARLVGAEDKWVLTPTFTALRIEGSGDVYTYVGTVRYPNGQTWQMIAIIRPLSSKMPR